MSVVSNASPLINLAQIGKNDMSAWNGKSVARHLGLRLCEYIYNGVL